tara:strand:+ start:128 stop:511 length:384 start_codon:yes stop_codon:yes gene_type:complete
MYKSNKRRKIDHIVNIKKRKNEYNFIVKDIYDVANINKRIKLLNLNISYDDFKDNYTEFTYDLSNGINLRKINIATFSKYLESINTNVLDIIRNSKYLLKYEKVIENDHMIVTEEDLWSFFEYELKQ